MQVDFAQQNLFLVGRSFGKHAAEGVAEERSSPEFEAFAGGGIAADVAGLKANAIHDSDIDAVRNGVRPLNGAPGIMLRFAKLSLLGGMPSDGGGIKENACSLQSRKPRAFRIPLIPANQRAESSRCSIKSLEAQIAGREIKLLVVKRIIGDVHLAVGPAQHAIRIENRGGVVIKARRTFLEERRNQHDFILEGCGGKPLRGRAGDRLRKIEESRVL